MQTTNPCRAGYEPASWIVRRWSDGHVVFETFQKNLADRINAESALYEAVPIAQYLGSINTADKRAALALQYGVSK
jgi:hypothetical protein